MSAYIIVDITVHDPVAYQDYVRLVPPFIEKHQGKYLVRGGQLEAVEGTWQPERLVVLEFPSKASARAFLDDPDYQPVAALRHAAATSHLLVVDGYQGT